MKTGTKISLLIVGILIGIQFLRIEKNTSTEKSADYISAKFEVPADVEDILKTACYDCHSNNTVYPWYSNIQPVGWWLNHHVEEGKHELNFDEFASYKPKRQLHKIEEMEEMVMEGEMPLSSYTLMHGDARLSNEQKQLLKEWCKNIMGQIAVNNHERSETDD